MEKADFKRHYSFFKSEGDACQLPFEIGGLTQCGRLKDHTNNQDALAVLVGEKFLIGVVCDGCTGTGVSAQSASHNEVGAKLACMIAAQAVRETLKNIYPSEPTKFLQCVFGMIKRRMRTLAKGCAGPLEDQVDFFYSYLMTTILGFVIDPERYLIFGCGDGLYAVNGEFKPLVDQAGQYLANYLINKIKGSPEEEARKYGAIEVLANGPADRLDSLVLATDGFEDLHLKHPTLLKDFACKPEGNARPGHNDLLFKEFRRRIWFVPEVEKWQADQDSYDDRSFILVRRIGHCNTTPQNAEGKAHATTDAK